MKLLDEFLATLSKRHRPATVAVYAWGARRAMQIAGPAAEKCETPEALRELLMAQRAKKRFPETLRISPLLRFLEEKLPKPPPPDYEAVRRWVVERIAEETKTPRRPSIFIRRDLAMLACLCIAPDKGSPRRWPKHALQAIKSGGAVRVELWDREVQPEGPALALLYWHTWRERLDRPDQSRIYRKAWASSPLLFPSSTGGLLGKQALHNAVERLRLPGERRGALNPGLIRAAFLRVL